MIQWIALAVAVDANGKASRAGEAADQARHDASAGSQLVIVRPVEMVEVPSGQPTWKLFGLFPIVPQKKVLSKTPWATLSIKKSDIINLQEYQDEDGTKYCRLEISEYAKVTKYVPGEGHRTQIGLYVPGSIEEVAGAIGGI